MQASLRGGVSDKQRPAGSLKNCSPGSQDPNNCPAGEYCTMKVSCPAETGRAGGAGRGRWVRQSEA